jgi:hypothetical protein
MKTDKAIVDFLCKPENLRIALEVADAVEDIYERVQADFFIPVHKELSSRLSASQFAHAWRLGKGSDRSRAYQYSGVWLLPHPSNQDYYLYYSLVAARESDSNYLYYGLDWGGKKERQPEAFPTKAARPLVDYAEKKGFNRNEYGPAFKELATFDGRRGLILGLSQRSDELRNEGVKVFWDFFLNTRCFVEATNASLKRIRD